MLHRFLSLMLVSVLVTGTTVTPMTAQEQGRLENVRKDLIGVQKIKAELAKRASDQKPARVTLKDGSELKGTVLKVADDDFSMLDAKSGKAASIAYADVKSVRGTGLSRRAKIGIGIGVGVGIAFAVLYAAFRAAVARS